MITLYARNGQSKTLGKRKQRQRLYVSRGWENGAVGKEHIPRTCVISNTHVKAGVSVTPALGKQTGDPLNLWADSVV